MSLKDFIKNNKDHKTGSEINRVNPDVCEISRELLLNEFDNGVQKGESSGVRELDEVYKILRGSQNCFTGYPNDGKTTFKLFLMTVKSLKDGWKWCFWSPEMKSASFYNGNVEVHYNDLVNQIISTVSGKPVYEHISQKYNLPRISKSEYMELIEWVKKHFICLDPKNTHIDHIYDLLLRTYEKEGYDGILIDPFKNVTMDEGGRDDQKLDKLFSRFKDLAIRTNAVMDWIAHPKANIEIEKDGVRVPCDQYKLLGGAAWNNGMDGIYTTFRPNILSDIRDPSAEFHNLKQRKQELTTERGIYPHIVYNIKTSRYLFNGRDVI